jgi:hypothetical protein
MSEIWLPDFGAVPTHIRAASKAIEEYDPDLTLGRDKYEWLVLKKSGPNGPFPVLGLGAELPGHDEIKRKMYKRDVRRHGEKLVTDMQRRVDARQREQRREIEDAEGIAAEAFEWATRKMGSHPNPRIFVPGG